MVDTPEVVVVPVVLVLEVKIVESKARRHVNIPRKFDLILNVGRSQIRPEVIVRIGRALAVRYRSADGWVRIRRQNGQGAVVEEASITKVVGELAADFYTSQQRVSDSSSCREISQVCLVEQILALSGIVVGGNSNLALV